jgi:hypothetical protein
MPIKGEGWEFHIVRQTVQRRASDGKKRTIGSYQVFHDGAPVAGLSGVVAECGGPGDNRVAGNSKRIEEGRYGLATQDGTKYDTIGYVQNESTGARPKPGIELTGTNKRKEILIHPGIGYLSSVGCINPATRLPNAAEPITYKGSRKRVIALIEDMKTFLGAAFPTRNSKPIPRAFVVIDGEP